MKEPLAPAVHRVYGDGVTTKEAPMEQTTEIRVEHPSLPYGYADGLLTDAGLFVSRREGAGWLWDVWASVEAFVSQHPVGLVAANLSRDAAVAAAIDAKS